MTHSQLFRLQTTDSTVLLSRHASDNIILSSPCRRPHPSTGHLVWPASAEVGVSITEGNIHQRQFTHTPHPHTTISHYIAHHSFPITHSDTMQKAPFLSDSAPKYNPVLHCTTLYCTVLYCTVVLYGTVLYCTIPKPCLLWPLART